MFLQKTNITFGFYVKKKKYIEPMQKSKKLTVRILERPHNCTQQGRVNFKLNY